MTPLWRAREQDVNKRDLHLVSRLSLIAEVTTSLEITQMTATPSLRAR